MPSNDRYDLIVIGSGAGLTVASKAHAIGPWAMAMVQPLVRAFGNLRPGIGQEALFPQHHDHAHDHE